MTCKQSTGRYEHKLVLHDLDVHELEAIVKLHPAMFIERYQPRNINNIYLDNIAMTNYVANVEGNADRRKVRVRWYGDLFGFVKSPTLEFKIKHGLIGTKHSYKLSPFTIDQQFGFDKLTQLFGESDLPDVVRHDLAIQRPTLINRYRRKYFETTDRRFRVTLDYELQYYHVEPHGNTFLQHHQRYQKMKRGYRLCQQSDCFVRPPNSQTNLANFHW